MRESTTPVSIPFAEFQIDILVCKGKYQERSKPPFTPGLEVSGVVSECCECQSLSKGDRVFCIFSANGGFSEECVVDESRCFTVPSVHAIYQK